MKPTPELIDEITDLCYGELLYHKSPDDSQVYYREPGRAFSYQAWGDDKDIPVDKATIKTMLREAIAKQLEQYGKVLLYTCKDNSLISIDQSLEEDEDLDMFDAQKLSDGSNDIFYIGFD